jgi:hypothetical protein
MFSQTLRKAVTTLFLAAAVTLSCAAPSQASLCHPRHSSEEPAQTAPEGRFAAFLMQLFDFIGGALDPNGLW